MKAAELALAAIVGAVAALAIVGAATAVLEKLEPVSVVLVDPPAPSQAPSEDLDIIRGM
jgi:hypothetical protein